MKISKIRMLISSIIIVIPAVICAIFSKSINGQIAIHWGINGEPDGFTDPVIFLILFPLILLALQWICVFITVKMNERIEQNNKITAIMYWLFPATSVYVSICVLSYSFGYELNVISLSSALFGVLFLFMGNYMPKCRQNSTMGIKIRWTLTNEENWNVTHRFSGKVWCVGGIVLLAASLLPFKATVTVFFITLIPMIVLPYLRSFQNYKKQIKEGRATKEDFKYSKREKKISIISAACVLTLLIVVAIIMFIGEISVSTNVSGITIESSFGNDVEIKYEDIDELSLTENLNVTRVAGFGSARLSLGLYKSEELGNVSCYCYVQNKSAVIIKMKNDAIIVVNCPDKEKTDALYDQLSEEFRKADN